MRSRTGPVLLTLLPFVVVTGVVVAIIGLHPVVRGEFLVAWGLLRDGEPEAIRSWLLGYGAWAPVVSTLLQIATSVFPPAPSFLLAIANAMVFGPAVGGLLTLGTSMLAAAICFGIARIIGRPGVERIVSPERLGRVDGFMERRGILAVFVGRVIPFINPDIVSYAAGVTGLRWGPFLIGMTAGTIPSTIFYSVVVATAVEATGWIIVAVAVSSVLPLFLLILFRRRILTWREGRRSAAASAGGDPSTE